MGAHCIPIEVDMDMNMMYAGWDRSERKVGGGYVNFTEEIPFWG